SQSHLVNKIVVNFMHIVLQSSCFSLANIASSRSYRLLKTQATTNAARTPSIGLEVTALDVGDLPFPFVVVIEDELAALLMAGEADTTATELLLATAVVDVVAAFT
ncbi:hypothetical protein, partial [Salmonella sp. s54412]